VWIIIILAQIAVLCFFSDCDLLSAIVQSFVSNMSFAFLGVGIWFVVKYNFITKYHFKTVLVFVLSGLLLIGLWMGFNFVLQNLISKMSEDSLVFNTYPFYQFTTGVFLYTILILVYRMLILFYKYTEKARSEEKLQKLVTETKLHALKAYINPHFLFNSLNSVNALISSDPEKAREMLVNLSDYFRYSLKQKDNQFINFEDEVHYTLTYFGIEQQRFGEKIDFNQDVCPECRQVKVPVMILQPLFENIIKHAVSESLVTIKVSFFAKVTDEFLNIEISNNYDIDGISKKGTGIGLATTYERLSLIYRRKDLLEYSANGGFFKVNIRIPINYKEL